MAGITLAQAQAQLDAYLAAETAALAGKSYEIDDPALGRRQLTRQDLEQIQRGIARWESKVVELTQASTGRRRSRTLTAGW